MDIVSRTPIDLESLADLLYVIRPKPRPQPPRDRSVWHVTNLLESAQSIIKGDSSYHEFVGHPSGIMSLGRIWEYVADVWLARYAIDQGGFYVPDVVQVKDGVTASLDGLLCLPSVCPGLIVAETKLRFSADETIPVKHERQMACYCRLSNTDTVAYTVLRIGSRPPTANAELIIGRISERQSSEVWKTVTKTKDYLESKGIRPEKQEGE